ncbi:hypothetical protein Fmac_026690 [Flemingia macrophylla]|uniref:Uncharacterized protein n=1 Tax=Flemingia macrophylla TaxID=520843 RepID=A0ABD1LFS0_9FABA
MTEPLKVALNKLEDIQVMMRAFKVSRAERLESCSNRCDIGGSKFSFSSGFKSVYDLFSEWQKIELDSWPALPNELFIGGWASQNLSIPWKEVESKLFVLNVVYRSLADAIGSYSKWVSAFKENFRALLHCKARQATIPKDKRDKQQKDKRIVLTMEDLSKALREVDPEISLSLKQSPTSYTQVLNAASRGLHRYAWGIMLNKEHERAEDSKSVTVPSATA